ncbi:MAG: hypothetical protein JWO88_3664 [Frankiales bacterium]|nr:hypothetical protein [Frankiales bacterium]
MLPSDRRRDERVLALSDEALATEARRARAREREVKPNKARRTWKLFAEACEAELERRGLTVE